jgi:hypothetical protein
MINIQGGFGYHVDLHMQNGTTVHPRDGDDRPHHFHMPVLSFIIIRINIIQSFLGSIDKSTPPRHHVSRFTFSSLCVLLFTLFFLSF